MVPSNSHPCLLHLLVAFFTIAFNYGQAACVTKSTTASPTAQPPFPPVFGTSKYAASVPAGAPAQSPFSPTHLMDMSSPQASAPEACAPDASSPEASAPQAFPPDYASAPEASSPEVPPAETSSTASLLLDASAATSSLSASMSAIASPAGTSAPEASAPETPSPEPSTPDVSAPETSSDTSPTFPATSSTSDISAPPTSASSMNSMDTNTLLEHGATGGTEIGGDPDLKQICDATDNPDLCQKTISPFLSAGKTDPVTVLRMAIKACMEDAQLALRAAREFTVELHVAENKNTASSLDTCKDSYSDAVDNLQSALGAIEANDMGTMNSMLSAAVTDFGSCTDAFADAGGSSPLTTFDDKLTKMASNSLAIVSLIKQ